MNVFPLADVDDHCLARVGQGLHRHRLGLPQFCPRAVGRLGLFAHVVGQLDPVEREVAESPLLTPALDHERKELAVLIGSASVRFALIPDRPLDAVADARLQHAAVDVAGTGVTRHVAFRIFGLSRLGLALGLRLVGLEFPLGHLLVVVGLGRGEVGLHLDPAFHERLQLLVGGELVTLHPGFGGAAAPGVVDQAHRHAKRLVELPAEEIADGGKITHRLGRARRPRAVEVPLRLLRAPVRHGDQPDVGKLRGGLLEVGVVGVVDAPLHVRLAGADPDLADEHVVERDRVLALDGERVRAAVFLHGIEEHVPHAVGGCGC